MANDNDYVLDLGVKTNDIVTELNNTISKIDETMAKSNALTSDMEKGFDKASNANKKVTESIKTQNKTLDDAKKKFSDVSKTMDDAFDPKSVEGMQKSIEKFNEKVQDISVKRKLDFEIDPKAFKEIETMSESLRKEYEAMQQALIKHSETLSARSQDTAETMQFNKEQVEQLNVKIKELEAQFNKTAPGVMQAGIKKQLEENTKELDFQQQELKETEGSYKAYQEEIKRVAQAQKDLTNSLVNAQKELKIKADAETKASNEIKKLEQTTKEAKEAEEERAKSLENTSSATGLLDSLTGGMITKLKDVIGVTKGVTAGFNTMKLALISTGLGAFIVLLGSLIAYFKTSEEGQDKFAYYMNIIGSVTGNVMDIISDFGEMIIWAFEAPQEAIEAFKESLKKNVENRVKGLIQLFPMLGKAIELTFKGEFAEAGKVATNALAKVALGVDDITGKVGKMTDEFKKDAEEAGKIAKLRADITVKERALLQEQANANRDVAELREKYAQKDLYSAKERAEFMQKAAKIEDGISAKRIEVAKMQAEAQIRQNALSKSTTEDLDAEAKANANITNLEAERARNQRKIQREMQTARAEESAAGRARAKERIEQERKTNEVLLKYALAYEESVLDMMSDSWDKRKRLIELEYENKIETLKAETLRTKEEIESRNKLIEQLEKQRHKELLEEEAKFERERIALQLEARAIYANFQKDSFKNDIELLEIDHENRKAKIEELFKEDAETRIKLITALEESTARERIELRNKWAKKEAETEEAIATATIEIMYQSGTKTAQAEWAKNVEILKIKKEFSQRYLQELLDAGNDENSLVVLQAKKVVGDLDAELNKATKDKPKTSIYSTLGLELTPEEEEALNKSFGTIANNVMKMTDLIVEQYDKQIQARKQAVNEIDKDINNLEKQLDKEKDLREQGFANNVEVLEKEIQEKQAQREEELRMIEELNEKKKQMQKAQFLFDSAMQAQNLITASTSIYKSLAPMGPFGIGLAVATIATMFGAFAMQKVKAFQAINNQDVSQFAKGGLLEGNSHANGGVKYRSSDNTNIKELEGGEYIVNTKQTRAFLPMLEAINSGGFAEWAKQDREFRSLMNANGIELQDKSFKDTLSVVNKAGDLQVIIQGENNKETYKEMLHYLKKMDEHNRNTTQEWEENGKRYIKKGNRVTIITRENG